MTDEKAKPASKRAAPKVTFEEIHQAIIEGTPSMVKDSQAHRGKFVQQPDLYAQVKPVVAKCGGVMWLSTSMVLDENGRPMMSTVIEDRETPAGRTSKTYALPVMVQKLWLHAAGESRLMQEAVFIPDGRDDYGSWLTYSSRYMVAGTFVIELVTDDGDQPGEGNTAGKPKAPAKAPVKKKTAKAPVKRNKAGSSGPMDKEAAAMAGAAFANMSDADGDEEGTADIVAEAIEKIRASAADGNARAGKKYVKEFLQKMVSKYGRVAAPNMMAYIYATSDSPAGAISEEGLGLLRQFGNDGGFEYVAEAVKSK